MSSRVSRTATSTNDVSQSRLSNYLDILLTTFRPSESTQDETKEVVDQGDFINFQTELHNKYYTSNNTHIQHNYYLSNNTHYPA